ncbi:glycosyltransferase family 2 protein [Cytobacillus firmus]|uniref:glycosyltransferase family 2 protein n=1 Tax=Cytobacillus firmus TaxID=1399 RepID=UPI00054E4490|nr:glycosyltransferase family 2 protein [Cytobacillus firmus]
MLLSVVIPCFNEEAVIDRFYEEINRVLDTADFGYELIFVNDGSSDRTLDKIKALAGADSRVRFISFSRNFGKEAGMLAGLKYASGDAMLIMDADLQHPPALIPQLVKGYEEGYDQVIAKRNRKGDAVVRSVISAIYYQMMNRFVDIELTDGIGDFRLLSRKAADALLSLSEYNRFSKGLFAWIGFKELVIEYENVLREEGSSKWSFSKLLNYGMDGIISFNNKPLRLSIYLGFLVTFGGLLYVLLTLINILMHGIDEPGYFTLIASILLFGGIQLIFMGIIGEYIGRIYYETKRRPHFIISEENMTKKIKEVD